MEQSFNPHWIGDESCRDYRIGNVVLKSVPDKFVLRSVPNPFYDTVLMERHVDEFVKNTIITIQYTQSISCGEKNDR